MMDFLQRLWQRHSPFRWPTALKRAVSLFTLAAMLLSLVTYDFARMALRSGADSTPSYWDNTTTDPLNFSALPKAPATASPNVVTFKNFVIDNGSGASFALNAKYTNTSGGFNPSSCTIMIEDAQDLYNWSVSCIRKNTGAANPTLERSVYLSAHYVLGNNIDYGQTVGMVPVGFAGANDASARFTGTFDGQGFEISNLTLTTTPSYFLDDQSQPCVYYAMFSQIGTSGVVKNIGLFSPAYTEGYGVNLSLKMAGIAGDNRGTVQYCFVVPGTARASCYDAAQIAGVVHTNESTGKVDNVYFAGGIVNSSNQASTTYNPVLYTGGGTVTNAFFDQTVYDATPTAVSGVSGVTTVALMNRTGILQDNTWYTDNYNKQVTGYIPGYPRLQGFLYDNTKNNSTTNPFYIVRPADLVFFSRALSQNANFGNSTGRYFRLSNNIDMTTVSDSAYTTPTNSFYGNFEGTASSSTGLVGTGDQLAAYEIINLRITKTASVSISSTTYLLMGLLFNQTTTVTSVRNLKLVGGSVTLPTLASSDAYNTYAYIGGAVSYAGGQVLLYNVHTSADVTTAGDNDYICRLRMGGLVGGSAYTVNAQKCSNSGAVNGGLHNYSSSVANTCSVGGLVGSQDNNAGGKSMTECANFGPVTGVTIMSNVGAGIVGTCYVGGLFGYVANANCTLDRLANYGAVTSVRHMASGASAYPQNAYNAGGIFGLGPSSTSATAQTDTRMFNKGTIYANRTDKGAGAAMAAGVAGNTSNTTYGYQTVGNQGDIVIGSDVTGMYAAGVVGGLMSLTNAVNDGGLTVENNAALTVTTETRLFGVSLGGSSSTSYVLTNCVNNKNFSLLFSACTAPVKVGGMVNYMALSSCTNNGAITVTADGMTNYVDVSGLADSSPQALSAVNNGAINVTMSDGSNNLFVAGVMGNSTSGGTASGCRNAAPIYVQRYSRSSNSAKTTYIGGLKVGYNNKNTTDVMADCQNDGEIAYDYYCSSDATSNGLAAASTVYIGGISTFALSFNRCINNGNIVLGKNHDFTGTTTYAAGITYQCNYNNDSNILQNCRNYGKIYNQYNIGTATNSTARTVYASGIAYMGPPNMSRCVNLGDITLTPTNTADNTGFYVSGVMFNTGYIDTNRVTYGVTGLANVGRLTVDHSATVMPANVKIAVSGIVCQPGTGLTSTAGTLPFSNLVNGGVITVKAKTDSSISYKQPGTDGFIANTASITVGGVSAMPAYNTNNANVTEIPLKSCANAAAINVDLKCGDATPSKTIIYNVGGIAGNSASNTAGAGNQKMNIYDSVNGGAITVDAFNDTSSSSGQSGVGGILGFGYQYTNNSQPAESSINSAVYNCVNYANVQGGYSTGGIVGCDGSVVKNVLNFGTVYGTAGASAGGIVGAIRGAKKNTPTRQLFALDGAINYGTVAAVSGQTPQYMGGILGNLALGQDATYGIRRYEHIVNASGVKFIGALTAQAGSTTFGSGTLVDLSTNTAQPAWETSDTFFASHFIYRTGGTTGSPDSIYYQNTTDDSQSFFWRVGEAQPDYNSCFVYLTPDRSARNTYSGGTYSPYPNGIYALSSSAGKKGGYYPSSNVSLMNCDPLLADGSGYTDWRDNVMPGNTQTVTAVMNSCRQIVLNTGKDILSLQLTSGGTTPITLRDGTVDQTNSQVNFYVVEDNFSAAVYTPDLYSANTVLSDQAHFRGSPSFDLSAGLDFSQTGTQSFPVVVEAEDGTAKNWTIVIHTVKATAPLTLTEVKEGVNIENDSGTSGNPFYADHPFTSSGSYTSTLTGPVSSVHNNTLILCFNTSGLLPGKNMIDDSIVYMTKADGTSVPSGSSSNGYGSNNKADYYKDPPNGSYGLQSTNFKVVSSDYVTYAGTLTVNIRLHSNLDSGDYKIMIATVYGIYTVNFTRAVSTEAEVQNAPSMQLIDATVGSSVNSTNALITNSANIQYGNAPDISKITQANGNGIFTNILTISNHATITTPQHLIGSAINADGSRVYQIGLTVTAEDGVTKKDWVIQISTMAYNTSPAAIEADYNGTTYFGAQLSDPDVMNNTFALNKTQSGTFAVRYNVTNGISSIYHIANTANYTYDIYRNNVLVPKTDYASYGLTVTPAAMLNNYLPITISADASLPSGAYELRVAYYRAPVDLSPPATDGSGNTYSQLSWNDSIQYPSFYFYKAFGKKFSYAQGFTVPYLQAGYSVMCGTTAIGWDGTNFDYTALGTDITSEANANYKLHREFDIKLTYKTDATFYNFKPHFILPDAATLYRETLPGQWEQVTSDNEAADFTGGKSVHYRVYAEDNRFYNDYYVTLAQGVKCKRFNITFTFQDNAPVTLPVSARLISIGRDAGGNTIAYGSVTDFNVPGTLYGVDLLQAGSYLLDVVTPDGYTASIQADNTPTANDITMNGRLVAGQWKIVTLADESTQTFNINVIIRPSGTAPPWGIHRVS